MACHQSSGRGGLPPEPVYRLSGYHALAAEGNYGALSLRTGLRMYFSRGWWPSRGGLGAVSCSVRCEGPGLRVGPSVLQQRPGIGMRNPSAVETGWWGSCHLQGCPGGSDLLPPATDSAPGCPPTPAIPPLVCIPLSLSSFSSSSLQSCLASPIPWPQRPAPPIPWLCWGFSRLLLQALSFCCWDGAGRLNRVPPAPTFMSTQDLRM